MTFYSLRDTSWDKELEIYHIYEQLKHSPFRNRYQIPFEYNLSAYSKISGSGETT